MMGSNTVVEGTCLIFFPAVRGVNKPATFWDWFIPVITCVFALHC